MLLIIDNYDSFTYNLIDYFHQLGEKCILIRNDAEKKDWPLDISGLIISPGPMIPQKAGRLMEMLEFYHNKIPILGICLGHQAIGVFFGAQLHHAIRPMHGKISKISTQKDLIFDSLPADFEVVRYHSLIIKNLPSELISIAETNEKEMMALRHTTFPIWGIQYHPEAALTQFGLEVLKNWLLCTVQNVSN